MKRFISVLIAVMICLGVGFTARYFQAGSIQTWYPTLMKSALTPPDATFPIVWGALYILMGISIGLTFHRPQRPRGLTLLFAVQLFLNFLWSLSFFYFRNPAAGLVNILILDIAVLYYTAKAHRVSKLSAWLMYPYVIWLMLATYLNIYILAYN